MKIESKRKKFTDEELAMIESEFDKFIQCGQHFEYWWEDLNTLLESRDNLLIKTVDHFEFGWTYWIWTFMKDGEQVYVLKRRDVDDVDGDLYIEFNYIEGLTHSLKMLLEDIVGG